MKEKIMKFFYGRYGNDSLNYFLLIMYLVFYVLTLIFRNSFFMILANACIIYALFRSLSRNTSRRINENRVFYRYYQPVKQRFKVLKKNIKDREYKYFVCPGCGQICRVPKKRGKITITCPRCHASFDRRS